MARYLLHRIGRTVAVLAAVTALLYVALEVQPGAMDLAICGEAGCPKPVEPSLTQTFGLDRGLLGRARSFATAAITLDFGPSLSLGQPAMHVLEPGLDASGRLALTTFVLEVLFLGAVAVANVWGERRWLGVGTLSFSVAALVVPLFWLGLLVRVVTGPGMVPAAAVLAFGGIGFGIRQVHERVRAGLDADHVRLARAYGVPERRIVLRHGLRPAVPRAIESLAGSAGVVLGGLVLLEPVFGRDGVGSVIATAIGEQDRTVVLAGVYVLLVVFVVARSLLLIAARGTDPPRADRWVRS